MKYLIIPLLFLTGCLSQHPADCHKALAMQVGGCDWQGFCGVETIEGPTKARYPVAGELVDVCFCNGVLQRQDTINEPRICE